MENKTLETTEKTEKVEGAKQAVQKEKKSAKRWIWRGAAGFGVLALSPIVFLATGVGQRTAIEWADKFVDELQVEQVEGSLQNGLKLKGLRYQMSGVDAHIGETSLHIGFDCLFDSKACVENMAVKDANIVIDTAQLPPSEPEEEEPSKGEFNLPLGVSLNNLQLDNVSVQVDEMDISLHHFHTAITGKDKDIHIKPTLIDGLVISLAPEAVITKHEQEKAKAKEKIETHLHNVAERDETDWKRLEEMLSKPLLSKLDPIKLPLNLDLPELKATNIQVTEKSLDAEGQRQADKGVIKVPLALLSAKADEEGINLSHLQIESDRGNLSGQGEMQLSGDYPLNWQITAYLPTMDDLKIPATSANLTLNGALFGTTNLDLSTSGAAKLTLHGDVQLAEPKTPLNLTLKSDKVSYPFMPAKGEEVLNIEKVDLEVKGDLLSYQLDTKASANGMGIPPATVDLLGQGGLGQFDIKTLKLNALEGSAVLAGKVDWTNGVEWQSSLDLNNINTKSITPDWVAQLSGKLNTAGYAGRDEKWAVKVSEMDVHGTLQQKKLSLKGELTADSDTLLNVPNASLVYGENTITMNGVIGDNSNFAANIKAPNLQGLVPNLRASINGDVKLLGKVTEPSIDLDLTANNVNYDEIKLNHLTAKGKVTTANQIQGDLNVALGQFTMGDIKLDNATLLASGSEKNHTLKLTSKGDPVGANLQISGKFDRLSESWSGQLSQVTIQSPVGEWKNDKAINVAYNNKQIKADISAHCWRNPKVNVCLPQNFTAGKEGKVPFEIKQFDLAMVKDYLNKDTQLTGLLNAKGDAAWFENKDPQINVELTSNSLKFNQKVDGKNFPLTIAPLKVVANMADNNLKLNTDIKIENNGRLTTDLVMNDLTNRRALSGQINIDKLTLDLVRPLLSSGESVNGEINARLRVGGDVTAPLLNGNLNLTGLKAKSNAMPFDITGGNLALNFNGASSTLKGNVQTPESNLVLEGDANWQKLDAWHTHVKAHANKFRVDVPGIAKVDVSPNIEVKATPKELVLGGKVDIPWARITVEELPESAVSASDDEVIILDRHAYRQEQTKQARLAKSTKNAPQNGSGMAIKADIAINVGNDVKVDAYGLKTNLDGTVKVRQGNKGLGLYGQINLRRGTFAAYGQDLIIRKGLIAFTGSPSQPTIDFEAIRNPEAMEDTNVTAGVRVTGIADSPDVKLFSTPQKAQNEILSYILTGRGIDNSDEAASGNSIAAALIGMSLSKSAKTVGSVGSAFGISDLSVSTAGIGDNTKVVVSGNLNPKFKVKYGVGIFAPLTELTLRYRLAPSLYLQFVSSVNQAVDLMYRFQF